MYVLLGRIQRKHVDFYQAKITTQNQYRSHLCHARQWLLILLKPIVGLVCLYISLGQIGQKGERKKICLGQNLIILDSYLLLLRAEVEYMFSGFRFRDRNADPAQVVGGKRLNKNNNSHHDEIEESPEKMGRFELDDSDEEFFFYLAFLSEPFTNHRNSGEGGRNLINSSLPLPPALQTLRH